MGRVLSPLISSSVSIANSEQVHMKFEKSITSDNWCIWRANKITGNINCENCLEKKG